MVRVIAFLCFLIAISESRVSYTGEQVLNCKNTPDSVAFQRLIDTVDIWGTTAAGNIDIRVKGSKEKHFVESLLDECKVVIANLEEYVRAAEASNLVARANASAGWFESYHTYQELDDWYQELANTHSSFITYTQIGSTYQGNPIKALRISVSGSQAFPDIYMQAQIHAREWISGATANYIINQLVHDYTNGVPDVVNLLRNANIHLVPTLNIDGYLFTWSDDRLWRKNRNPSAFSSCIGTDVNRNYNDHWGEGGSSTDPCSQTYMGVSVQSENETQATQGYWKGIQQQGPVIVGVDWHSSGQLVLRPYGWTSADSPDEPVLKQQGDEYAATILATSGRNYTSQKSIDLYVTTGTASDWFYGADANTNNLGLRAAGYTVELRPRGEPGFLLPPEEIIPTGNENYRALIPFLSYFLANPLFYPQ